MVGRQAGSTWGDQATGLANTRRLMSDRYPKMQTMTPNLKDYIEEGRALDADEREIAVLALQEVDEKEQREIDAAWHETVERRLSELSIGGVQAINGRETLAIARARSADI